MFQSTQIAILAVFFAIADSKAEIDFNRDIRPVLSENCFHCHGPDAGTRKADLRLDLPGNIPADFTARISHHDPDELMPPPDSKRQLTGSQIQLLSAWANSGAPYAEHWAWEKPVRPPVPAIADPWIRNPIDAFILRRLLSENLTPSPPAKPQTLARRLHLDLVGLPPAPGATADTDTLLASPRFGEKWARHWLDLARYADSNGFQADQLRPSWAYRDWVIDALNANMPFDQFTVEQLAGDLLPNPTLSQKIATGFHRTVTCNVEAGVHPEENRTNQVIDRVNTTATTWLGVTLECAQCHDHKYDPFSMRDYYQVFAYFNNTPLEVELPSSATDVSHDFVGPYLDLPLSSADAQRLGSLQDQLATLKNKRKELASEAAKNQDPPWTPLPVTSFESTGEEDIRVLDDASILLSGSVPDKATYTISVVAPSTPVTAFRLETLTHPELPGTGPGRGDNKRNNFVLHEISLEAAGDAVPLISATADFSQKGWPSAGAIDGDPKTGWAIAPQFSKQHWITFRPSKPIAAGTTLKFSLTQNFGSGRVVGRPRLSFTTVAPSDLPRPDDALEPIDAEIAATNDEIESLSPDKTLVMVELPEPRDTHIMDRGSYLSPLEEVTPDTPGKLHPPDPALPKNRLGLARWITSPQNPLTARVTVNRWWAELFGHGLVATLEDFGTQSEPPSHPDLLDWLAVELIESGWDMKHLLKTITGSATYRQSSHITPALLETDPGNKLYARAPRFRLSAEAIRDNALAASGLLSTKTGGGPIMPHQPPGLWRQTGRNEPVWKDAKDEDRFRRGIYIVYRRAAPYPSFVNFDAPDRASCTTRRPRTNTPLQALTLLNDPAYTEIAVALADRALTEQPSDPVARIFQLALNRRPSELERAVIATLPGPPDDPAALIAAASPVYRPKTADAARLVTHFHIAQAVLNLDETITKP